MSYLRYAIFVLAVIGEVCCDLSGTCILCPAGTFLKDMCALDADTQCWPCHEGTFSATASHRKQCSTCSECPEGMYVDKPCQTVADTVCAPCSSAPIRKSDHFVASCERANAEGSRVDLDNMMMSDVPDDTHTSENFTNEGNIDSDYNHDEAGNTRDAAKEKPTNSSTVPGFSLTNLEHEGDLAEKNMSDNGDIISHTNKVHTDEGQNSTQQEDGHGDKAILMPLPVKDRESDNTTDLTILSANGNSSLDEVRLGAVRFNDEEDNVLSDNVASNDNHEMNNTDREFEGIQADAPTENQPTLQEVNNDTLSDNKTGMDHHARDSSGAADRPASQKPNSAKVPKEDSEGRKRAAIILGVVIAGLVFFTLVVFASRCLTRRRGKFKEMTKVNNYDQEAAERRPLSYSDTGSYEDPEAEATNGLYRQGPPLGPSSPRTNPPKEEKLQPSDIQVVPETSLTIPILTVSPAPEDLPEPLSDHEPLVSDVGKLKYIDESTDDEYVMTILNKIPFSRLSHVVEEPLSTHPST